MTFEDFGLTNAQVTAAINGSEADRAAVFGQIVSSDRVEELLEYLQHTKPQKYQVIAPYLRYLRDQQRGLARSH